MNILNLNINRSVWCLVGIYDKNALACLSLINDKLKSI